jgi:hypothetical protein
MANKVVAYNSGTVTAYGTKYGNHEVGTVANNYRANTGGLTWYNSPTYGNNDYVMISNSYDLGFSTQGNSKPLFWVADNDASFIAIVNKLRENRNLAALTTIVSAISWVDGSGKYYLLNQPFITSNLLLHYNTFNTSSYNGSGTTITDLSGNGRNGTIAGSPTWTTNYFTFIDDYITTPNLSSVITSANEVHSVELWVHPTDNGLSVQYNNSTTPNTGYHHSAIEIVGGNLEVGLWNGAIVVSTGNIGAVSFNQWHQIVLTYNGSVCKGYIDGVYKGSVNVAWDSPMNTSMPFYMSFGYADSTSQGDGSNFDGRFGIMRVYNIALNDAQVLSNYNSTVSTIVNF